MKKQKKRTFSKQIHEGDTVTFFFHDNTKQIQIINKAFLFTNRGRRKSNGDLINDLNAVKHDIGAKYIQL